MRWQFSVPLKLASKLKAYHRSIRWVSVNLNWLLGDGKNTSIHRMHELTPTNAYIVYMMNASERVNGRTRGKYREKALQQTKVYFMCRIIENKSLSVLSTHIHKEPFIIVYSALVIYAAFRIWYVILNCMQLLIFGVPTPFFCALHSCSLFSALEFPFEPVHANWTTNRIFHALFSAFLFCLPKKCFVTMSTFRVSLLLAQ